MVGAALDWLFDMLCEHALLGTGARLLWALQLGRRPLALQMERTVPNLIAGACLWAALLAIALALV